MELRRPGIDVISSVAKGLELMGLLGAAGEVSPGINLFGEARYNVDFIFTSLNDNTDVLNLGGFSVVGGIRIVVM